ncbi:MAG TPA: hypothetical protein VNX28_07605, partial [Gemmataceae bacterium]|nr:hypothetical protein [Gemmataceae bacterium]
SICQTDGRSREDSRMAADASEPLLSVKLDETAGQIHVVRAILSYVWEGFDAGDNVIQSRETTKWVRELVGTISLDATPHANDLRNELTALLHAAVQGTSRLPLNSVEAPLPAFSLGQLAYVGEVQKTAAPDQPRRSWRELLEALPDSLEIVLRSINPGEAGLVAAHIARGEKRFPLLLRRLFTNVSLSPYTFFVDTTIAFVKGLVEVGALSSAEEVGIWGWLLRQLGRHLTAYDLVTFHYRGANYPDALLLDAVFKRYLHLIESLPDLFQGEGQADDVRARRLRRRAFRQGCLSRYYYQGHPVPDAPTSPGENARVLAPPHVRVPEEQLLNVLRRRTRLYAGEPLTALLPPAARTVLAESIHDLADPSEWRELGAAVFIDRPLGWGKEVGEPDVTPLLAHEAFSPSIARRRLRELERLVAALDLKNLQWDLTRGHENLQVPGLSTTKLAEPDRPTVSLADARRVADDFVVLRTLPQGLAELFRALDFTPLRAAAPFPGPLEKSLLVRLQAEGAQPVLAWFDGKLRKRLEMWTDLSQGFIARGGREIPGAGLRVMRIWDENGEERKAHIHIPPRS